MPLQTVDPSTPRSSTPHPPRKSDRTWLGWLALIAAVLALRLITMHSFPLVETTEPRYAEISRLMATSGDWITPWFDQDTPFWGKPPLSFWAQATSIQLFGSNPFSVRLPSWLAMIGCLLLTAAMVRRTATASSTWLAPVILITMTLPYVSAGAVMTDAYLTFGTTLALLAVIRVSEGAVRWGWWFFVGLAIGLLAKGPIALVLAGLPLLGWLLWQPGAWHTLLRLPWFSGTLLTALIAAPWYLAAELKTPGFLEYFLLGEHLYRFIDPGWQGDLYGTAHQEPKGKIWLFWFAATFPWGIAVLGTALSAARRFPGYLRQLGQQPHHRLLLCSALAPLLFFTLSGNILWTYVLPGLPATAILFARVLAAWPRPALPRWSPALASVTPTLLLIIGLLLPVYQHKLNSAAALVTHYQQTAGQPPTPLYYVGEAPFSARFYSQGRVQEVAASELSAILYPSAPTEPYVVIATRHLDQLPWRDITAQTLYQDKRYTLLKFPATHALAGEDHCQHDCPSQPKNPPLTDHRG